MAAKNKKPHVPQERDDGTRWTVIDIASGNPVYLSAGGSTKAQATRLAEGMLAPARIEQIEVTE